MNTQSSYNDSLDHDLLLLTCHSHINIQSHDLAMYNVSKTIKIWFIKSSLSVMLVFAISRHNKVYPMELFLFAVRCRHMRLSFSTAAANGHRLLRIVDMIIRVFICTISSSEDGHRWLQMKRNILFFLWSFGGHLQFEVINGKHNRRWPQMDKAIVDVQYYCTQWEEASARCHVVKYGCISFC